MSETLFKKVDCSMSKLMDDIEMGTIGLPDIQQPFLWKNSKVRDLFDSIFRGYPVGYFLFWQNAFDGSQKQIGSESKQKVPNLLIVEPHGRSRLIGLTIHSRMTPHGRKRLRDTSRELGLGILSKDSTAWIQQHRFK